MYVPKTTNLEQQLLLHDTKTTKRYNKNFFGNIGNRKDSILKLRVVGRGRLLGAFSCINDQNKKSFHSATAICDSERATVLKIKKEDLWKLKMVSEDSYIQLIH